MNKKLAFDDFSDSKFVISILNSVNFVLETPIMRALLLSSANKFYATVNVKKLDLQLHRTITKFYNLFLQGQREENIIIIDKTRANPERHLRLIIDGMDQAKLSIPHYNTLPKVRIFQFHWTEKLLIFATNFI